MAQCIYQRIINDAPVACGKCMYCKAKRISGWSARLMKRDMASAMSFFVTFTYNPDSLMFCPKGRPTLYPSHLTNYWKLLRKKFAKGSISYYACGEYGSNRQRPHYHALVFIQDYKVLPMHALQHLQTEWKHGEVFVGTVTGESVAYVLKYLSKKPSVPQYSGDKRTPEFQRVSKGMGAEYLTTSMMEWHMANLTERAYIPTLGGGKAPLPRYYKDKLYTKEQKLAIGQHMEANSNPRNADQLKELQRINYAKINKD
ncbi:MAG: replication initiator protein [Arizlama microvirus]|nr:MAG: replication initiator protein [Arizlama microvirus]